jgi:hypothetical protein
VSISSVAPTLSGAPEALIRRSPAEPRPDRLPVDPSQLINPRQAVDGRPQTIQIAEPSDGTVRRRNPEDGEQDEAEDESGLTDSEQQAVAELKQRDQEVRRHEQAHLAAAGPYLRSGPQYDLVIGPDGKSYAQGGEVQLDAAPIEGDPAATLRKLEAVQRAALAPADPSAEDRRVAAVATRGIAEARQELAAEQSEVPSRRDPQVARASSEYVRNDLIESDPRRSLFDFTV